MANVLTTLVPLIVGSAVVPIQILITILLLKTERGVRTAFAWIAGMTVVKLVQGVLFGFVFTSGVEPESQSAGTGTVASILLLVVSILFLVTAFLQLLAHADDDAPPPKWMSMISSMTPLKSFLLGAGLLLISANSGCSR